ncbi:MAG: EF-hand domain-containing protein [Congregibacter sp.]
MSEESTEQTQRIMKLFEHFDANDDGRIDESEFAAILSVLGWDSPRATQSLEFAAIDGDEDGLVEPDEFIGWWLDRDPGSSK